MLPTHFVNGSLSLKGEGGYQLEQSGIDQLLSSKANLKENSSKRLSSLETEQSSKMPKRKKREKERITYKREKIPTGHVSKEKDR